MPGSPWKLALLVVMAAVLVGLRPDDDRPPAGVEVVQEASPGPSLIHAHVPLLLHPDPRDVVVITPRGSTLDAIRAHGIEPVVTAAGPDGSADVILAWGDVTPERVVAWRHWLRPAGLVAVRMPIGDRPTVSRAVAVMRSSFDDVTVWRPARDELMLVGSVGPLSVDHETLARRMRDEAVAASLAPLTVTRTRHLLAFLLADGPRVERLAAGEGSGDGWLDDARGADLGFLHGDEERLDGVKERTIKAIEARGHLNRARALWHQGDAAGATAQYHLAYNLAPSDPFVREWPAELMADATRLQSSGEPQRSIEAYEMVLAVHRNYKPAELGRVIAMLHAGRAAEAVEAMQLLTIKHRDWLPPMTLAAWVLATHPDASVRQAATAVEMGERAAFVSRWGDPTVLDTLAAAYAEAGRFEDAVATAEKALGLAEAAGIDRATRIAERIEGYRRGVPYRDPSGGARPE